MPALLTRPPVEHFVPVEPTKDPSIRYASLKTVDLAKFDQGPEARQELADTLKQALHEQGFFVLINHGLSEKDMERQTDIGWTVFTQTSVEDKKKQESRIQQDGHYRGWKLRNYWEQVQGVSDRIEQFNFSRDLSTNTYPTAMLPFMPEVETYTKHMHNVVVDKIFQLCAQGLELPLDEFTKRHQYAKEDKSWFRTMAYYDEYTAEEEAKLGGVWLTGHVDFTCLSLLFSQPMAALQVRDDDGTWVNVQHVPGAMIVNAGQFMHWYTGGYYRAAIHRVAAPPLDQRNHVRFSAFYFVVPNDDEEAETLIQSPVLASWPGLEPLTVSGVTSKKYCDERIRRIGKDPTWLKKIETDGARYEVVAGVRTPFYID